MTPDKLREEAFREFEKWFIANYPGPETIISDPAWHAPKIFRSATHRLDKAHAAAIEDVERVKAELADALLAAKVEAADADRYQRRAERLKGHADRMRQILTIGDGGFPCRAVADYDAEFKGE